MFSTAFAFIKRDFLIATSYKSAFAFEIIGILFKVTTFFYVGEIFGGVASPVLNSFGGDYFAFLLIGVALMDFMKVSLEIFDTSIRESQMMGTLEIILLSPIKLSSMLLYSSLWAYIFTSFRFGLYLFFGIFIFGFQVQSGSMPGALVFLILSIVCFAPIGVISASVIMIFKKGAWFRVAVSAISFFLCGVVYPITVLPEWIKPISALIPMTHALAGMRHSFQNGLDMSLLMPDMLYLLVFSGTLIPISLATFHLAVKTTKENGTLTNY